MDISIIIVNFNTAKMTGECIDSIYKHIHGIDFEIILVDNNSTDNSVAYLKEKFPDMELISLKENIGFGRANNCGAKKAKGKYLFLLNSDTLLFDNALFSFFNFCEKHNKTLNIGVVGGTLLNTKGEQFESFDRFPRYTSELAKLLAIHTSSDNYVKTLLIKIKSVPTFLLTMFVVLICLLKENYLTKSEDLTRLSSCTSKNRICRKDYMTWGKQIIF